jgi:AcrR family transcriptional regulator
LRLFAEQGFSTTTVRQIASAVGVTDAALYAHFTNKQAIFDRLIESMGPPTAALMGFEVSDAIEAGPQSTLTAAVDRLLDYWSRPDVQMFTAVLLREGTRAAVSVDLAAAIESARAALTPLFVAWQEAGQLRNDLQARQIVWELLAPLNNIRFLYLRHDATKTETADARRLAAEHLDYFLTCTLTSPRRTS